MRADNTSDLEELSQHVAVHPDDNERRWSLAKKLYMAWEYNEALKHLLILKKNWARRLNVLRYLAAAYYRLGLYDEAIAELRAITQQWPNEVAVFEQLARVYEVAGRTDDAAATWEQVVRIHPAHPTAARSVQRLRSPSGDARREDLRLRDSDSGIDLSPYRICRSCGAQNSDEFDRCWQCHAALRAGEQPIDSVHTMRVPGNTAWRRTFVGGMSTVAALSAGLYITLVAMHRLDEGMPLGFGPVYDTLARVLLAPRLGSSVILALVWPASLWFAFRVTGARPLPWPTLCGAGMLLASLTYLAMWLPVRWLLYAPAAPAIVSLIVVMWLSEGSMGQRLTAWVSHGVFVVAAGVGGFAAIAGPQVVREMPDILAYDKVMLSLATPGAIPIFATTGDGGCFVHWESTGCAWLDRHGRDVIIEAVPDGPGAEIALQLRSGDESLGAPGPAPNTLAARVSPETRYTLHATAPTDTSYVVHSRGALQPINDGKLIE
ncbi:MAG: tetratricopeptide repeat protein [Candidatus Hydrogenedentes bacterium]|nr:tetratricopeptide repeat protein [Candidatus Hydrogenedentota bacterium]